MPYYVEKGPYFSVLEDFASDDTTRLLEARAALRSQLPLSDMPAVDPAEAGSLPPLEEDWVDPPLTDVAARIKRDWFGQDTNGDVLPLGLGPGEVTQSGWWMNYHGDVEAIMRETLIRAADAAMGLDNTIDYPPTHVPDRHWPIQIFWVCGSRWFEGWVSWRQLLPATNGGVVTVVFVTPGTRNVHIYDDPRSGKFAEADYKENPTYPAGKHGLWVVSAQKHRPYSLYDFPRVRVEPFTGEGPTPPQVDVDDVDERTDETPIPIAPPNPVIEGDIVDHPLGGFNDYWDEIDVNLFSIITPIASGWHDVIDDNEPIVVVQPCESDGGVLPGGRPYLGGTSA